MDLDYGISVSIPTKKVSVLPLSKNSLSECQRIPSALCTERVGLVFTG